MRNLVLNSRLAKLQRIRASQRELLRPLSFIAFYVSILELTLDRGFLAAEVLVHGNQALLP